MVEFQADRKQNAKHTVEEAMTAALLRKCNSCGKAFLKEGGCNKMYCTCGNQQCFVCSANVAGYDHFDKNQGGTGAQDCPLYDDTAKRLRDEVAAAQVNAVTEVLQKRSDLTAEEVTVDDTLAGNNREPLATTEREAKLMGLDKVARHYAGPMYFDFEATERRQQLLQEAGRTERRRVRREERQRLEDERQ